MTVPLKTVIKQKIASYQENTGFSSYEFIFTNWFVTIKIIRLLFLCFSFIYAKIEQLSFFQSTLHGLLRIFNRNNIFIH